MGKNTKAVSLEGEGRSSQTYIIITAFLSLLAIVGFAYYGPPFFFDFMTKEFGWSRTVVTSGNALAKFLVGPLFGFIAGYLIDRYGPRLMLMAGALMGGFALIGLGSISGTLWTFYFFYLFNALGYVFGGPLPCQVLISRWFDKNRGKAMGIAYLGIGIGGAFSWDISNLMVSNFGWHYALIGLGILVILIAFPFSFFIKDAKPKFVAKAKSEDMVPMKNILKNRNFYLLAFGSMCSIAAVGGIVQHFKLYLVDHDFTQTQAAHLWRLVLLSSLVGRVLMGTLADIIHRKYVMILIYMIVATAIPLLLVPNFPGRIYIFAVIFGIGLGGDYMIIPLMAGDLFGVKALGRTMGIILVSDTMTESGFPMIVGKLYDITGNYTIGFSVLICMALIGTIIVSFLPDTREKMQQDNAFEHS
jgi:sugar phosphate permease